MRRTTLTKLAAITTSLLLLAGCVTTWTYPTGPVSSSSKTYSVRFPEGWTYLPIEGGRTLLCTYDGPQLESITVTEYDLSKELPFSKETLSANLAVEDLGDALFQEYFKTPGITGPTLESAAPAQLDKIDGVEIVYSFSNGEGLRYRAISRAVINKQKLYVLQYAAPVRHYFDSYDDKVSATTASFTFAK